MLSKRNINIDDNKNKNTNENENKNENNNNNNNNNNNDDDDDDDDDDNNNIYLAKDSQTDSAFSPQLYYITRSPENLVWSFNNSRTGLVY